MAPIVPVLLWALTGCCTVNRTSLHMVTSGRDGSSDVGEVVAVVGDAVKSFGFKRRDEHVLQSELTIYSLTPASDPQDLINVIIDRKTLAITLVEYRQQRSSLATQVKKALEANIAASYGIDAQFKELPCPSSWP